MLAVLSSWRPIQLNDSKINRINEKTFINFLGNHTQTETVQTYTWSNALHHDAATSAGACGKKANIIIVSNVKSNKTSQQRRNYATVLFGKKWSCGRIKITRRTFVNVLELVVFRTTGTIGYKPELRSAIYIPNPIPPNSHSQTPMVLRGQGPRT